MINNIKSEVEKRTGLPANVVDQVVSALGQVVSEHYPQYAGIIGPMLGIPTQGGTASSTGASGGGGLPDLGTLAGDLGGIFGGQNTGSQGSNSESKS